MVLRSSRNRCFEGVSDGECCRVTVGGEDLPPRDDIVAYRSDPFSWGVDCAGSRRLALAMLAVAVGDAQEAYLYYLSFASECVSVIPGDTWIMSVDCVRRWYLYRISSERWGLPCTGESSDGDGVAPC